MDILVLNAPVLTDFGTFHFKPLTLDQAKQLVNSNDVNIVSAVGHKGTAHLISHLLKVDVPYNRVTAVQKIGQIALVFRLKKRIRCGIDLTEQQLAKLQFDWGLLFRKG